MYPVTSKMMRIRRSKPTAAIPVVPVLPATVVVAPAPEHSD
jgi:hypothetical protein